MTVATRLQGLVFAGIGLVEFHVLGFERDLSPVGHGIARVQHQVHDDLLDLAGISFDRAQLAAGHGEDFDVFADEPPQHGVEVQHNLVQIDHAR